MGFEAVCEVASQITPVPSGIGPMALRYRFGNFRAAAIGSFVSGDGNGEHCEFEINFFCAGGDAAMKKRVKQYGDANWIGKNVEQMRKKRRIKQKDFIARLQTAGLDINPTSYSKLEGQLRSASDKEVYTIARVLGVTMEELF